MIRAMSGFMSLYEYMIQSWRTIWNYIWHTNLTTIKYMVFKILIKLTAEYWPKINLSKLLYILNKYENCE